jgi:hypothetical protein
MPRDHMGSTVKDPTVGRFFLTGIFWFKLYRLLSEFKNACNTGYIQREIWSVTVGK